MACGSYSNMENFEHLYIYQKLEFVGKEKAPLYVETLATNTLRKTELRISTSEGTSDGIYLLTWLRTEFTLEICRATVGTAPHRQSALAGWPRWPWYFPKEQRKSLSNHMKEFRLNSTSGNKDVSLFQKEENLKIL